MRRNGGCCVVVICTGAPELSTVVMLEVYVAPAAFDASAKKSATSFGNPACCAIELCCWARVALPPPHAGSSNAAMIDVTRAAVRRTRPDRTGAPRTIEGA